MSRELLLVIHLAGVISWMAGILYLIRLFVYHSNETHHVVKERFVLMERRLYRGICVPAMIISALAGIGLVLKNSDYFLSSFWFRAKVTLVLALIFITLLSGRYRRKFEEDLNNQRGHVFFRVLNEIPTLLMIIILYLVFFRP